MAKHEMPEEIWLQTHNQEAESLLRNEWTHCDMLVHDTDVKYIREDVAQEAAYLPEAAEANFKVLWEQIAVTKDDLTQSAQKLKDRLQAIVRETGWKPTTELTQDFIGWLTKQRCIAEQHLRKEKNND